MYEKPKEITLDEAIAHFEAIAKCAEAAGVSGAAHEQHARFLRRLRVLEEAIKNGDLIWASQYTTFICRLRELEEAIESGELVWASTLPQPKPARKRAPGKKEAGGP